LSVIEKACDRYNLKVHAESEDQQTSGKYLKFITAVVYSPYVEALLEQ